MERFVNGTVVIVPFPFSDLSGSKKRPAYVIADLPGPDIILCQITSQPSKESYAVKITDLDFTHGSLPSISYIRPTRIFTADKKIIVRRAGKIRSGIIKEVIPSITDIINNSNY